jgi:hypothetical protein
MQNNNKNNALIITIGTRDVQIDLNILKEKFPEEYKNIVYEKNNTLLARHAGEHIHKHFQELQKHLSFPIIQPTLEYLEGKAEHIDFILLIATDQEKPHQNDTCFYAEIIKRHLITKYTSLVKKVEIFKVKSNEVTYLDKMYSYFSGTIPSNKHFKELSEHENIYLHLVGGIDAVNNAIRFNAIQFFGTKIKAEIHVNEEIKSAVLVHSVRNFLQQNDINTAQKMIQNYFYEGIRSLNFISEDIKNFAEYAHWRLMFDFKAAGYFLSKIQASELRDKHLEYMNNFNEENKTLFLRELFWNTHIKYTQKNYVDFLLRFFRLAEEFLIQEVLKIINITYEERKWGESFKEYLTQRPQMEDWLKEKKLSYNTETPSTYLLRHILQFLTENNQYPKEDYEKISHLYDLKEMRNKGIGAHSFDPPDEREIKKIYETKGVCDWLKVKLGINNEPNPFDEINTHFQELLKQKK